MSKHHHHHPKPASAEPATTAPGHASPAVADEVHPAPTEHVDKPGPKGDDLLLQKKDRPEKMELHPDDKPKDVSFEDVDRLPRNDADHPDSGVHPVAGVEQKPFEDLSVPSKDEEGNNIKQSIEGDGEPEIKPDIKQFPDKFETYEEAHESAVDVPLRSHEHEQQDNRPDAQRLNPGTPLPPAPNAGNLGSGSKSATGNPEEFGQNDKAANRAHAAKDPTHPAHDRAVKETAIAHGEKPPVKTGSAADDSTPGDVEDVDNPDTHPRVAKVNEPGVSARPS